MYLAIVLLAMLVLPLVSIAIERAMDPSIHPVYLAGRWFVFWAVGVRLALAGLRQFFQPAFTAREIFRMKSDEALPLVRELGIANFSLGVVGLASLALPTFVLPAAVAAAVFYGIAGVRHAFARNKSRNETIAMASDLLIALVLALYAALILYALFASEPPQLRT